MSKLSKIIRSKLCNEEHVPPKEIFLLLDEVETNEGETALLCKTIELLQEQTLLGVDDGIKLLKIKGTPKYMFSRDYGMVQTPVGNYAYMEDITDIIEMENLIWIKIEYYLIEYGHRMEQF